jgi:hypothetical protein
MELKSYYAQDTDGSIIPGAYVYLYEPGTTVLVSGHKDTNGENLSNPFQADEDGLIQFSAPDGRYDLRVTGGGLDRTIPIQCLDATDAIVQIAADADRAESHADRAEVAKDAAQLNAGIFTDTTAGLAGTSTGDYFSVPATADSEYLILYLNNAGVAEEQKRYPSTKALEPLDSIDELGTKSQRYLESLRPSQARPKAAIVILLGQSLNAARGTIVQAAANKETSMFVGGAHVSSFSFWPSNQEWATNWSDVSGVSPYQEAGGQTPGSGIASTIVGGFFSHVYVCSIAIGARAIANLLILPRANLYAVVERACEIAENEGYEPYVMFYSAHGEADASAGTSENDYYARALEYYQVAQLAAAQFMRRKDYWAPVVLTYPVQQAHGDADRAIKSAIDRVAKNMRNCINLGPIYQWPCEADRVHPTPDSYVKRGESVGLVLREYFERSNHYTPLKLVDVAWDGATEFVATFNHPVTKDITLGVGQQLNTSAAEDGVEWFDNGAQIPVSSIQYEGFKIRGTLASAPTGNTEQQALRIAVQDHSGALAAGPENLPGSVIRKDSDGWPSLQEHIYINYEWASPQTFQKVRMI